MTELLPIGIKSLLTGNTLGIRKSMRSEFAVFRFNEKECAMPQQNPALESLLSDPLIQKVMRADRVEPKTVRSLVYRVAMARGLHDRDEDIQPSFLGTPLASGPLTHIPGGACGAALCC